MEDAKWCFVPTCLNSTRNTFNKWFVPIPVKPKRREQWFKAVNRNYCPNSERSILYCCSDHFNLDEDAGSFFQRDGEIVVKLKKSIVPRLNKQGANALKPSAPNIVKKPKQKQQNSLGISPTMPLTGSNSVNDSQPLIQPQQSEVVSLIDGTSSEDEDQVDMVGVVTSDRTEPKHFLGMQKIPQSKQNTARSLVNQTSSVQMSKPMAGSSRGSKSKPSSSHPQNATTMPASNLASGEASRQALRALFDSLRKSIPSVSIQQGLTREQILSEAIEFIIQMRNKSDKRQGTMHYVMENNTALTAKIQHLENLISLHETNEIVLTKEIVERRLGAVAAQRPASLNPKPTKSKTKR